MDFTPGPWKVVTGSVFTEDDRPIANMVRDDSAYEAGIMPVERDRNAYLCAAAPDLLEACSLAMDDFELEGIELNHDTVSALRKALFNATGLEVYNKAT